jgi:hypothetical protein
MKKILKYKLGLILIAIMVLAIVAIIKPEAAEMVARAFMLIIAGV